MLPHCLTCIAPADDLYELRDGRYQLLSGGTVAPLMTGYRYVLADQEFLENISQAEAEGFATEPAIILNRGKNLEIDTHSKLTIFHNFSSDSINDLDLDGDRLILMDRTYLFCTPSLATNLVELDIPWLNISPGLSRFA